MTEDRLGGGVSRRGFLKIAGAAALLPSNGGAEASRVETKDGARRKRRYPGKAGRSLPFSRSELMDRRVRDTYEGESLSQVAFPLGGIGSGCVSFSGTGRLVDWEIFNRPNKGFLPRFTFLSIWAKPEGGQPFFRVLEGPLPPPYEAEGFGPPQWQAAGLPRFRGCRFTGRFPFARVHLEDEDLPLAASVEAWSPFIPGNSRESSLPVAVLMVTLRNPSKRRVKAVLGANLQNLCGYPELGGAVNEVVRGRGFGALTCTGTKQEADSPRFGTLALATTAPIATWQRNWLPLGDFMSLQHFVDTFAATGKFDAVQEVVDAPRPRSPRRPDIVFEDFESGTYGKWTVEGEAFRQRPSKAGDIFHHQSLEGWRGCFLADSFLDSADAATGKLTSAPFTLERRYINFLIGGGSHPGRTCMNLLVDGKVARTETGSNSETLMARHWDVGDLEGRQARLEIVDAESGGWGHILVDHIVFSDAVLPGLPPTGPGAPTNDANAMVGSIGVAVTLAPGEEQRVPFLLAWHFPNVSGDGGTFRNYYATQWEDALAAARYAAEHLERLERDTRHFQEALFASTLPGVVLEAISSQLSILRSPTVIRFPQGTLWGWEGCNRGSGCCAGTCNHVWNYQQAIPYLFPDLQRSMLVNFLKYGLRESDGCVQHRMPLYPEASPTSYYGAVDGQMGQICQVYRDWQISGDDAWIRDLWPRAKKALEYAWAAWDRDKDGLMEGSRLNTLDLEFSSPETMCGSLYQAALLAGEKMALYVGDREAAREYRRVFELGKRNTDAQLFNGEYYHQKLPAPGDYQLGIGCISEQLHGQLYSRMLGFEDIYDRDHIHTALAALFRNNYCEDFTGRINANRVYSLNDERGVLIATWPRGGKPVHPLLYCDETQIGYEYQVAGNLLYEGYLLEGLTVIKSIRDRFDGRKRNPYNEFECGNHYVRSMANYNALLALSGFRYSGVERALWLAPQVYPEDFRVFFGVEGAWGSLAQKTNKRRTSLVASVAQGRLRLRRLHLRPAGPVGRVEVRLGDRPLAAGLSSSEGGVEVLLDEVAEVTPEAALAVDLRPGTRVTAA